MASFASVPMIIQGNFAVALTPIDLWNLLRNYMHEQQSVDLPSLASNAELKITIDQDNIISVRMEVKNRASVVETW